MDIIPFQDEHSLPAEVTESLFSTLTEEQDPLDYIIKQYQDENQMWCYKIELKTVSNTVLPDSNEPAEPTGD